MSRRSYQAVAMFAVVFLDGPVVELCDVLAVGNAFELGLCSYSWETRKPAWRENCFHTRSLQFLQVINPRVPWVGEYSFVRSGASRRVCCQGRLWAWSTIGRVGSDTPSLHVSRFLDC